MYWDQPGPENTDRTAEAAVAAAVASGARHIVFASNTGFTAQSLLEARERRGAGGLELVGVTHHVGFHSPGEDEMPPATRRELEAAGVRLLTTTHLFGNVERAVTQKHGGLYPGGIIAQTLKLFGQGIKVCVEVAVMALDAGLIPHGEPVVAVGGSGRGADAALLLRPAHARDFFDTEILEFICKPRRIRRAD